MFQNVPECFMFQVLSTPGDKTQNPKHSRTFWNMKKMNIFFIKKLLHIITIIINNNNNNKIKIIIIIIIIVNYNYHKKIFPILCSNFLKRFITLIILYIEDSQTTTR